MRSRRELFSDSLFFIFNRARIVQRSKCWQQEAMGMAKATRRLWLWSRLQLLPAPPPPPPRAPGPSVLLQLQLRCQRHPATARASDLGTVTVGASGSRREAWPQSQRVKDRGVAGHSPFPQHERVCEQTPHVPRSSKHDRARTRRWPHAQLQRPVRGPGIEKGSSARTQHPPRGAPPPVRPAGSLGSVEAAQPGARQTAPAPK